MKAGDVVVRKGMLRGRTIEQVRRDAVTSGVDPSMLGRTVTRITPDGFVHSAGFGIDIGMCSFVDRAEDLEVVPETPAVVPIAPRPPETFWATLATREDLYWIIFAVALGVSMVIRSIMGWN